MGFSRITLMIVLLLFLLSVSCVGVGVNAVPGSVPQVTMSGYPTGGLSTSYPGCPPGTPPWLCTGGGCPPGTPPWLCTGGGCPPGTPPWLCTGGANATSFAAVVEEIHASADNKVRIFKVEDLAGRTWWLPHPPITVVEGSTPIAVNDVVTIEITGHGSIIQRQ